MPRVRKLKSPAVMHYVPQTREQTIEAIAELGTRQRDRIRIEQLMNDELAEVKARYEAMVKPHNDRIVELTDGIKLYCEANRAVLTRNGKVKTHVFASGEVCWRTTTPTVELRKKVDEVIAALKEHGLDRFIRTKEEVNKERILEEPEAVAEISGIKIKKGENFSIQPFEAKLQEVA